MADTPRPPQYEVLPSGKKIIRNYNNDGTLRHELHAYGMMDIGISYDFHNGVKIQETYFLKTNLVSRKRYEKARSNYPDLPAPDETVKDWGKDLLKAISREKKQQQVESEKHIANPEEAAEQDNFCIEMLEAGKKNAIEWVKSKTNTLGEMDWARSQRLVKAFSSLGCKNIFACEIDSDGHGENTGHLVIELPKNQPERKKILKKIDTLAREQGYAGPFDNGQRYAYVKLD